MGPVPEGLQGPSRRDPGGIVGLLDLIDEHRAAVKYDLLRHGYRLEWLGTRRLWWGDAVTIMQQQPPTGSAVARALFPDEFDRSREVQVLEVLAVLLRQANIARGNPSEARESAFPSSFEDLFDRPKTVPHTEAEILAAIADMDAFLERTTESG